MTNLRVIVETILLTIVVYSCGTSHDKDGYLRSLEMNPIDLAAVDSCGIPGEDFAFPLGILAVDDDWIVMRLYKGDHHLMFLNTGSGESFQAIRVGRGPGEIVQGNNLAWTGEDCSYCDLDNSMVMKFDPQESIKTRKLAISDTVCAFKQRPVHITPCGNGYLTDGIFDPSIWYSYSDSTGEVVSSIPTAKFEQLGTDRDAVLSFWLSSKYHASPDGSRVCVANVQSPSLSFATVNDGILTEVCRTAMPPAGMRGGHLTPDYTEAFVCIDSNGDDVYLLYSGNRLHGDELPSYEAKHLIVYGWDGKPKRRFLLDRNINSFTLRDGKVIGCTSYPKNQILIFDLPDE